MRRLAGMSFGSSLTGGPRAQQAWTCAGSSSSHLVIVGGGISAADTAYLRSTPSPPCDLIPSRWSYRRASAATGKGASLIVTAAQQSLTRTEFDALFQHVSNWDRWG